MSSRFLFFSGKGGVGKTTSACATAVRHADGGRRTLIVSTDPASNLSDVFGQEIGHRVTAVAGVPNLAAMEIDPDEATREYKEGIIAPYRDVMPEDVIASIDEQLSGPCTTEMAAFDRFIDFMEGDEYEIVVFDTAPTGHTIRLLELPVDWSRHIEESSRGSGQTCLGPVQTIQGSRERYDRATALLRDRRRTTFTFVLRPDDLSLYETARAAGELGTIGIVPGEVIVNGLLPEEACGHPFFRRQRELQQRAAEKAKTIAAAFRTVLLRDGEVRGLADLRSVGAELFEGRRPSPAGGEAAVGDAGVSGEPSLPSPDLEEIFGSPAGTKAVFFTGKGGVGKTTVSCLAALAQARRGRRTLLVTTDPAAHLGQVLDRPVGSTPTAVAQNLDAVMIDQEEAFREYKERTLAEARGKYSEAMLLALEEELNSPCTEEMAAFDRFIRFIEEGGYDLIVLDTAPTGHTLRLLDLPFDYARQVELMRGGDEGAEAKESAQSRFSEIIRVLRDPARTAFAVVLYPEATPILESSRAVRDLRKAGIESRLVVANMLLSAKLCTNEFFRRRRAMQLRHLAGIGEVFGLPVLTLPLFEEELKGIAALEKAATLLDGQRTT